MTDPEDFEGEEPGEADLEGLDLADPSEAGDPAEDAPGEDVPGEVAPAEDGPVEVVAAPAELVGPAPFLSSPAAEEDHDGPRLSRRDARTRALEVLFAADVRDALPSTILDAEPHIDPFTRRLVDVVIANRAAVDALIATHSQGWALDRMPAVDRSVLRLGIAEMLYVEDVPPKVAVDEAVELAKSLSTDASPKFVNGVLAAIARANDLF